MTCFYANAERCKAEEWLPSDYSADGLQAYFTHSLKDLIKRYAELNSGYTRFNTGVVAPIRLEPMSYTGLVDRFLTMVWDKIMNHIRESYVDGINARFEINTPWSFPDNSLDVSDNEKLFKTLTAIDWSALSTAFNQAIQCMSEGGRHNVAATVLSMLNAYSDPIRNATPKWIKGRYVAKAGQFEDSYNYHMTLGYETRLKALVYLKNQVEHICVFRPIMNTDSGST